MPPRFFGQYLLEQGVITREMLLDAMQYQKSINLPLCALAVERGYLTAAQLKTLDADNKTSDRKFMEEAVKQGMLTFQQLEELAEGKSERWLFLGEALVQRGHITLTRLQQVLKEYRDQLAPTPATANKLGDIAEKSVVAPLLDVTVDLFVHYTKQIVQVASVEHTEAEPDSVSYVFSQEVRGDKNFHYALALPEKLTLSIASHIIGEPQTEPNDLVLDAVSEFVNVVIGNGCTRLSMQNYKVTAQPPLVMTKEMLKKLLPAKVIAVNLKTARDEFRIFFFFTPNAS